MALKTSEKFGVSGLALVCLAGAFLLGVYHGEKGIVQDWVCEALQAEAVFDDGAWACRSTTETMIPAQEARDDG